MRKLTFLFALAALVAESARGHRVLWAESYLSVADSDSARHFDIECSDGPPGSVLLADILSGSHGVLVSLSVASITDVGVDLRELTDEAGAYSPVVATGDVLTIKRVVAARRGRITGVRSALADDGLAVLIESQSPGVPIVLWFDIPTRTWVHEGTIAEPGTPPAPKEAPPSDRRP